MHSWTQSFLVRLTASAFAAAFATKADALLVSHYSSFSTWQSYSPPHTTIDFTGVPPGMVIVGQYATSGVSFPDGDDFIETDSPITYPHDGCGLSDVSGSGVTVTFGSPQDSIAAHYPGLLKILFYSRGQLIHTTSMQGGDAADKFTGYVLTEPFDKVILLGGTKLDNLYFGQYPGSVTVYHTFAEWDSVVATYTTLSFTGFPASTVMSTQYAALGVTFPDHDELICTNCPGPFPLDGSGLSDIFGNLLITLEFTSPQYWFAAHHLGFVKFKFYYRGALTYWSDPSGDGGPGQFTGCVSTVPFDKVEMYEVFGLGTRVDNFYFGRSLVGDLNDDENINGIDLAIFLAAWGPCPKSSDACSADLDGDGVVTGLDLAMLLGHWTT